MNFKQTVLSFFSWVQSKTESSPEPATVAPEATSTPQRPVMMASYRTKSRKVPGRRGSAGSR